MPKKRTKIVCTIGPASGEMDTILAMLKAGMDVARINFSHGDYASNAGYIKNVRGAAQALKKPVAIIQDLQGPRVRTRDIPKDGLVLDEGDMVTIISGIARGVKDKQAKKNFQTTYKDLYLDLKRGSEILIDDGLIKLKVLSIGKKCMKCRVVIGGLLTEGRGMNFPQAVLSLPSLTKKDRADLEMGVKLGVDFVALSFVQRAEDIVTGGSKLSL